MDAILGFFQHPLFGNIVTPLLVLLVAKILKTPKDHERAALLAHLASDIAAVLVLENKTLKYGQLLQLLVEKLKAAGVTENNDVITRVAAAALAKSGVTK